MTSIKIGVRKRDIIACAAALWAANASAAGGAGSKFLGADFSYNGFIRVDTAFNTSSHAQVPNQFGDPANGVPIPRAPGNPLTGYTTQLQTDLVSAGGIGNLLPTTNVNQFLIDTLSQATGSLTGGPPLGVSNIVGVNDVATRYVPKRNNLLNYHLVRFEATPTLRWGDISLITRIRAAYDPDSLGYEDFDPNDYKDINGGFTGGLKSQYRSKPNRLGAAVNGATQPLIFEHSGRNYSVDLPAFFLQYNSGDLTVRLGNQSVAWGQLLFFRIMDTANGLDLRRHLILNRAVEEYSDSRMSAPGIRLTYQISDQVTADAFAQQFIPTILNSVNSPYNVVASQFIVEDRYIQQGANEKVNYGIRFKGEFGNYNLQAMYTHRRNPLGAIRWTQSGVDKALPNDNLLGAAFNQACQTALIPNYNIQNGTNLRTNNGCGPLLARTAFEASPAGVMSAEEWFNYASFTRLSGLDGLNKAVNDFPAAQAILAQDIGHNIEAAGNELSAFFVASDGLHGHIERRYYAEDIFGIGGGYVTEAEPGSIFDQIIMNVEATYTPKRVFTSFDLGQNFDKRDEIQVGFVAEKYQRFSTDIPATYMLFQYLWQKNSDLVGLRLNGYGSENYSRNGIVLDPHVPTSTHPKITPGIGPGANYVVFAALQPFPNYIYELSAASLIDVQGGILFQPGLVWKPQGNVTVNLFYNLVLDNAWGNNPTKNLQHFLPAANEAVVRLGYQF